MSEVKVLDHGYIKLIESWGSDERIIEAARMSTDKGFRFWGPRYSCLCGLISEQYTPKPEDRCMQCDQHFAVVNGDEKLLAYLYNHKHMTPFEMAGMIIEVQAPIFVFREWHRHRTQSYNELSARYTELPNIFYLPSLERLMNSKKGIKNKQGSESGFTEAEAFAFRNVLATQYSHARDKYEYLLQLGVSKEIARLVIPVAQYSRMRASANLRNWLAFLTLRMDPTAQFEIRTYAFEVGKLIGKIFPKTFDLFMGEVKL